jgi:hypothetical protein
MDPDPDPTPDLNPFFSDFKDVKKYFFYKYFVLITYPQAHHFRLKINFLLKIFCEIYIFQAFFHSAQHIYEKREGSGAGSGSIPLTVGSGSGRPKTMQIRIQFRIRIPNTGQRPNIFVILWLFFKDPL